MSRYLKAFLASCVVLSVPAILFINATPVAENKVLGWIDAVSAAPDGVTVVSGWACDSGKSDSINVHIYAGGPAGKGTFVQSIKANLSSELAVGKRCADSANAPHRYRYFMPANLTAKFEGQVLYAYGISTSNNPNLSLMRSGELKVPPMTKILSKVVGFIDGIVLNPKKDGYLIRGWACQTEVNQSIALHVYFGLPTGQGVVAKTGIANLPSTEAIGKECLTTLGQHTFSIPLSMREYNRFTGQKLYVYGISTVPGGANRPLARSGIYAPVEPLYEEVSCDEWDGVVDRNIRLSKGCTYTGQVFFKGPDLNLDCNNGTIASAGEEAVAAGIGQGIGLYSSKNACESGTGNEYFEDPRVDGSVIKNCTISNFKFGIYFRRHVWKKSVVSGKCVALGEIGDSSLLHQYLGGRSKRHAFHPASITLRNVNVKNSKSDGIFVNEYAQDWLIENSSTMNNSVGIYLEREGFGTKIYNSVIKDNRILGIAIDASAKNIIDRNVIDHNGYAGVSLYKNCGEANGVARYSYANNNIVQRNIIKNHGNGFGLKTLTTDYFKSLKPAKYGVGVWIASRQGMSPEPILNAYPTATKACVDEAVATSLGDYYQDHSEGNIIRLNEMSNNQLANVIVEDDNNVIEKNKFFTSTNVSGPFADVIVGSVFRGMVDELGPVKGNKVIFNSSTSKTILRNYETQYGSTDLNNLLEGNTITP